MTIQAFGLIALLSFCVAASAQATTITYTAALNGGSESSVNVSWGAGIGGAPTVTSTLAGLPLTVTSGVYDRTFDAGSPAIYNPELLAGSVGTPPLVESVLVRGRGLSGTHVNIPTAFLRGQIRGPWLPVAVPESASLTLLGLGLLGVGVSLRAFSKDERAKRPRR